VLEHTERSAQRDRDGDGTAGAQPGRDRSDRRERQSHSERNERSPRDQLRRARPMPQHGELERRADDAGHGQPGEGLSEPPAQRLVIGAAHSVRAATI
jgi:hypothetical protein